jgi:ribosomal protein S18 acetylase RimI-like enzyme
MILIRKYSKKDMTKVANLICKTFSTHNFDEGTPKAIQTYLDKYNPKKIGESKVRTQLESTNIFFVAIDDSKIVGVIRGVKGKIINLFVDSNYHGRGIGTKLLQKFEENGYGDKHTIKVKASLFGIPFYKSKGFKKTTGQRAMKGLFVQPMKKIQTEIKEKK